MPLVAAPFRSGVKVTFKTDLGQKMTCGAARKPYGYDSPRKNRDDYSSDDDEDTEYESRRSYSGRRQLLQPQVAHNARTQK
jgi:hypothetical protein